MTHPARRCGSSGGPGREALDRFPFLRASRHRWVPEQVWAAEDAAAAVVPGRAGAMLVGAGDPAALADLLGSVGVPDVRHVMLTRGTHERLAPPLRRALEPGRPWDWLLAAAAPAPVPGEQAVARVAGPGPARRRPRPGLRVPRRRVPGTRPPRA